MANIDWSFPLPDPSAVEQLANSARIMEQTLKTFEHPEAYSRIPKTKKEKEHTDFYLYEDECRDANDDRPHLLVLEENRLSRNNEVRVTINPEVTINHSPGVWGIDAAADDAGQTLREIASAGTSIRELEEELTAPTEDLSIPETPEEDFTPATVNWSQRPGKRKGKGSHKTKPWDQSSWFR